MSGFDKHMANYRRTWAREIRRYRRTSGAEYDIHIDHDWDTTLIDVPRERHRAEASRERRRR